MNERIDRLFEQALDRAVPETWTTLDADQLNRLKAKFAELIVRECIEQCDQVDVVGADECIENIREYFGVER